MKSLHLMVGLALVALVGCKVSSNSNNTKSATGYVACHVVDWTCASPGTIEKNRRCEITTATECEVIKEYGSLTSDWCEADDTENVGQTIPQWESSEAGGSCGDVTASTEEPNENDLVACYIDYLTCTSPGNIERSNRCETITAAECGERKASASVPRGWCQSDGAASFGQTVSEWMRMEAGKACD